MPRVYDIKRQFEIELIDLIRPDSYWPQPYSIEQAFQTFRWLAVTGDQYSDPGRWGPSGVRECLSTSSGVGLSGVSAITSVTDLRKRFHYALLSRGNPAVQRWRADHGLFVGDTVTIPYAVHKPFYRKEWSAPFFCEADVRKDLKRMQEPDNQQKMAVSLNYVHHWARNLHGVQIHAGAKGFRFELWYGTAPKSTGSYSHWSQTIAKSRDGETFLQTLGRARTNFDLLVHGKIPAAPIDLEDSYWSETCPLREHVEYQLAHDFQTLGSKNASLPEEEYEGASLGI